jgi:hypothetical protein
LALQLAKVPCYGCAIKRRLASNFPILELKRQRSAYLNPPHSLTGARRRSRLDPVSPPDCVGASDKLGELVSEASTDRQISVAGITRRCRCERDVHWEKERVRKRALASTCQPLTRPSAKDTRHRDTADAKEDQCSAASPEGNNAASTQACPRFRRVTSPLHHRAAVNLEGNNAASTPRLGLASGGRRCVTDNVGRGHPRADEGRP